MWGKRGGFYISMPPGLRQEGLLWRWGVRHRVVGVERWEPRSVFHISMPRVLRQDGLWSRWPVAQRRVRPLRVVFHPPSLRQNLCLLQRVKNLSVKELISQLPVEALTVPVLPWAPRLDIQRQI